MKFIPADVIVKKQFLLAKCEAPSMSWNHCMKRNRAGWSTATLVIT
jgi:hypothetical protein